MNLKLFVAVDPLGVPIARSAYEGRSSEAIPLDFGRYVRRTPMALKQIASNPSTCFGRLALASAALATAVVLHAQATPLAGTGNDHKALITIDPPGSVDTRPFGIKPQGDIVGQYFTSDRASHGLLLSRGNYTRI